MRVVIAEDSVLLREGIARILGDADIEVVGSSETADDLLLQVKRHSPHLAIVDIRLPPTHNDEGLRAALEIRTRHPSVAVLVLSQYVQVGLAMKLLADGRGSRLPAQGSHRRRQGLHRRRAPRCRRRLGDRPDHRLDAPHQTEKRRPARRLDAARARGPGPHGRRELESGDRGQARDHAPRRRALCLHDLHEARSPLERQRVAARARGAALPALVTRDTRNPAPKATGFPPIAPWSRLRGSVDPNAREEQR